MTDEQLRETLIDHLTREAKWQGAVTAKLENIERLLLGNGTTGLASKVESLEASRNRMLGGAAVLSAIWAFLLGIAVWLSRGSHR